MKEATDIDAQADGEAAGRARQARRFKVEWPTLLLIVACYGAWLAIGLLLWPAYPMLAVVLLGLVLALQSSLMHEASHGHPTGSPRF